MFSNVDDVKKRLEQANYICSREISTVVYLAAAPKSALGRPGPNALDRLVRPGTIR